LPKRVISVIFAATFSLTAVIGPLESYEDRAWASLRSKRINISKPLTLVQLVDIAMHHNPATRQAWENVREAGFVKKQAQSQWYPQVTFSAAVNKEKTISNQSINDINEWNYGPAVKITYLLLDFGGRDAAIEEASQNIVSANFQLNQTIQDLLLNVESAYYNLYSANSSLKAAESDLANSRKVFYSAQQRFNVGLASKLDILQAKANYDNMRYSLEDAKLGVKTAKANVAQVIGFPADAQFEVAQPSGNVPTQVTEKDVAALIEEAIKRRPDIISAQADFKAKEAAIKAANSDLWPTVNLGGNASANRYKYLGAEKQREHDHGYSAYASVDWDAFDGFYNLNKKRQAETAAAIQYEKLIEAELEVSSDVWTSYYNFDMAVSKLRFSRTFLHSAAASYEMALESYNEGLKSILDLLDALSKLSDARSQVIGSQKDVFVALAQLAHSTGSLHKEEIEKYD
jgi:TolC family type I secretion outer membrane protein